jgi:hypothetical protein
MSASLIGRSRSSAFLSFTKIPSGLGVASSGRIIALSRTMFALLHSLTMFVIDFFKRRLEAENLFLRHQLSIGRRRHRKVSRNSVAMWSQAAGGGWAKPEAASIRARATLSRTRTHGLPTGLVEPAAPRSRVDRERFREGAARAPTSGFAAPAISPRAIRSSC